MRAIKRKRFIFAAFTAFGIVPGILLLVFGEGFTKITIFTFVIITILILIGFWIRELEKLKGVRLIAENPIIHIKIAVISELGDKSDKSEEVEYTEMIVSYFGILLDEKIIKFNQDGIRLMSVEIGKDFISFTYGTIKRARKIKLLRPAIDLATIAEISEKFRFETGITPIILY